MSVNSTKAQHYVPQIYLKRFCDEVGCLHILDKRSGAAWRTISKEFGFENYFYKLNPDDYGEAASQINQFNDETDNGEKYFGRFEAELENVIHHLLEDSQKLGINKFLRRDMGTLLRLQHMRTPQYVKEMKASLIAASQGMIDSIMLANFPDEMHLSPSMCFPDAYLKDLLWKRIVNEKDWEIYVAILSEFIWYVGRAKDKESYFVTSDMPIARRSNKGNAYTGVFSDGIEIAYPLDSKHILILREPKYHKHQAKLDGRYLLMNSNTVRYYNRLQAYNADRFLCASNDNWADILSFLDRNEPLKNGCGYGWNFAVGAPVKPQSLKRGILNYGTALDCVFGDMQH